MAPIPFSSVEPVVVATGQRFPEGPAFDAAGNLHVCNRWDGFINRIAPDGSIARFVATDGKPNGSRFHADGRLFIADIGRREILAADPSCAIEVIVSADRGLQGPNDLVFDRRGRMYFTDPGLGSIQVEGYVYRWSPDEGLVRLAGGLTYPNGLALSSNERTLHVAETGANRVSRFPI
jgi:gluconolactonase